MGVAYIKKYLILFITVILICIPLSASYAHPGRTDSNGGHSDFDNQSGLGDYHYHCNGHPAHLHENGICPYANDSEVSKPPDASKDSLSLEDVSEASQEIKSLYNSGETPVADDNTYLETQIRDLNSKVAQLEQSLQQSHENRSLLLKILTVCIIVIFLLIIALLLIIKFIKKCKKEIALIGRSTSLPLNAGLSDYIHELRRQFQTLEKQMQENEHNLTQLKAKIVDVEKTSTDEQLNSEKIQQQMMESASEYEKKIKKLQHQMDCYRNYYGKSLHELVPDLPPDTFFADDLLPSTAPSPNHHWGRYTVYITQSGHCYHKDSNCSSTVRQIHIFDAILKNMDPCKKCATDLPTTIPYWYYQSLDIIDTKKKYDIQ